MKQRERKNNLFKEVPAPRVQRSLFDLSHEVKMSGKFGFLYPVLCMEVLPGDTVRDEMNAMIRFAPMLAPIMHRIDVTTHFFKVPCRILTNSWEDFITGGQDGTEAPILPYVTPAGLASAELTPPIMGKGSLWDYMGLPIAVGAAPAVWSDQQISALPFRAMGKIWNDYYRDPNLDTEMELGLTLTGDVSNSAESAGYMDINKFRRAFEKDYFTSALPWAQRGAQVLMPLSGIATDTDITYRDISSYFEGPGTDPSLGTTTFMADGVNPGRQLADDELTPTRVENIEAITFENAATTINDFRRALAIQKWLEANARGGARYVEQIFGHFKTTVPDYRLQRAEYLGGGKQPVQISEVMATAETEGTANIKVGDMAGHGISVGKTNRFTYRCQEHGFIIGIMSITMRTAYSQGIPKMWMRADKFDYAWPELANLGEQEIASKEVFFSFDNADETANDALFGYIPRYAEYKFHNDRIAGDFRDNLGFWHLGRKFTIRPTLDTAFTTIYEDGEFETEAQEETFRRIFAVQDGTDYLWCQLYHRLTTKRPLPYFGVPTI